MLEFLLGAFVGSLVTFGGIILVMAGSDRKDYVENAGCLERSQAEVEHLIAEKERLQNMLNDLMKDEETHND